MSVRRLVTEARREASFTSSITRCRWTHEIRIGTVLRIMILILLIVLTIAFLMHQFYWKRRGLPPGPTPLPVVGNLMTMYRNPPGYDVFIKWSEQYGPVYTYWIGPTPVVVITSYDVMKKHIIQDGDKFADRTHFERMQEMYRGGLYGIIETDGDYWKQQRRFTLQTLRDFGMGKNLMEQRVLTEVDYLFDRIEKQGGTCMIGRELTVSIGCVVNGVLFGYRFDDERVAEFLELKQILKRQATEFSSPMAFLLIMAPILQNLPVFKGMWDNLKKYRDDLFGFFNRQIEEHEKEIDYESEESSDFVEAYLKEQHRRRDEPDFGGFMRIQLQNIVLDLWVAGLETTSNTLTWGMTYLLHHPEVIDRMQKEMDTVVGSSRKVELADKSRLPYCHATVCEVQRLGNIVPINLLRKTGEDVEIEGFLVPKGTAVMPQISSSLYDEKVFPEPYKFDPSRFIDEQGQFKTIPEFVPFSMGKRQCAGEGLARLELFLFMTNIVHRYKISSTEVPPMKKTFETLAQATNFECSFVERR